MSCGTYQAMAEKHGTKEGDTKAEDERTDRYDVYIKSCRCWTGWDRMSACCDWCPSDLLGHLLKMDQRQQVVRHTIHWSTSLLHSCKIISGCRLYPGGTTRIWRVTDMMSGTWMMYGIDPRRSSDRVGIIDCGRKRLYQWNKIICWKTSVSNIIGELGPVGPVFHKMDFESK